MNNKLLILVIAILAALLSRSTPTYELVDLHKDCHSDNSTSVTLTVSTLEIQDSLDGLQFETEIRSAGPIRFFRQGSGSTLEGYIRFLVSSGDYQTEFISAPYASVGTSLEVTIPTDGLRVRSELGCTGLADDPQIGKRLRRDYSKGETLKIEALVSISKGSENSVCVHSPPIYLNRNGLSQSYQRNI